MTARAQCTVRSATLRGAEGLLVTVEVAVTCGLPGIAIVGMPDAAVQEARERVRSAISAAGFSVPGSKIVVNLSPGDVRKIGSGFDLPIAVGLLAATGQIPREAVEGRLFAGELLLDGRVRAVRGMLAFGLCAARTGCGLVSAPEAPFVPCDGLEQLSLASLASFHEEEPYQCKRYDSLVGPSADRTVGLVPAGDFRDVAGHDMAKRALQIAAAGNHGLLMMGPPGSGKTMLASRIGTILPPLSQTERLEAAVVHSVAGEEVDGILAGMPPFRSPHHSATIAGLVGGGSPMRPGEVSLAHRGVLFLDELAEFRTSVLQSLRQPMEKGMVSITRADGNVNFPARFMLVAATNPCSCGYAGDDERPCTCTIAQIRAYQGKIGGPLMDRISIQLDLRRLPAKNVLATGTGTSSADLRDGVMRAREFASWRKSREGPSDGRVEGLTERSDSTEGVVAACRLNDEAQAFIASVADAYAMSGRGLINALRVSRTIADMAEKEEVTAEEVAEAIGFRLREGIGG